jgi:PAS domain S-box-containing protein
MSMNTKIPPKPSQKKGLKNRRKHPRVGVLIGDVNTYTSLIWEGLHAVAEEQRVDTICFMGRDLSEDAITRSTNNIIYQLINEKIVDGLIVLSAGLGQEISHETLTEFCRDFVPIPVVSVGEQIEGIPSLFVDNRSGLRDLFLHLIDDHGYRRLAFVRGPEQNPDAQDRYQVYKDVLAERQIPFNPDLILPGGFHYEYGEAAVRELLGRNVEFDAICAADDDSALGVLSALHAQGYHVPRDVAVTGFDDISDSQYTLPPLTTVRQPIREVGKQAFQMMFDYLKSEKLPQDRSVLARVVIRQSCGCPSSLVAQIEKVHIVKIESAGTLEVDKETLFNQRQNIENGLIRALGDIPHSALFNYESRVLDLLDAFYDTFYEDKTEAFLFAFDKLLRLEVLNNQELTTWQAVLSEMRRLVQPYLTSEQMILQAENLWQKARVFLSEMGQQSQARRRMQAVQQALTISQINQELITAFDFDRLIVAISESFPLLEIEHALLFLFEALDNESAPGVATGPAQLPPTARLILAYVNGGCIDLEPGWVPFPTVDFIPAGVLPPNQRYDLLVMPLHFQSSLLGYAILEMGLLDGFIYDSLEIQISTAIQGALLIDQLRQAQTELEARVEQRTAELSQEIRERIRVEKNLRENEQRYRALFEQTNDAVFILDLDGNLLTVNKNAADLLGYSQEELIGMSTKDIVPDVEFQESETVKQKILSGETLPIYERTFRHKDGKGISTEVSVALAYDMEGNPSHIQSIVRDITKRKRSERLLHALNSAATVMQKATAPEELFVAAGDELKKLGFSSTIFLLDREKDQLFPVYYSYESKVIDAAEKYLGKKARDFTVAVDAAKIIRQSIRGRQTVFIEDSDPHIAELLPVSFKPFAHQLARLLGVVRNINSTLIVDDQVVGMLSVQSDDLSEDDQSAVTAFAHQLAAAWSKADLLRELEYSLAEQLRIEDALRQSEDKYRTLFDLAPIPIVLIGINGIILDVNQAAAELGNMQKKALISESFMNVGLMEEDELHVYMETFASAVAGEKFDPLEIKIYPKDSQEMRWVEVFSNLIKADDDVLAVLLILRDITERKRVEQERQQLIDFQRLVTIFSTRFINLATREIQDAIQETLITIGGTAGVEAVSIWFFSEDGSTASKRFGWFADGSEISMIGNQDIPISEYLAIFGPLLRFENIIVPSVAGLPPEQDELKAIFSQLNIVSFVATPMVWEGKVIGSLSLYMQENEKHWTDDTVALLKIISDIFVNALERKRAEENIHRLNEELEERVVQRTQQLHAINQELEAFAYSVSHDLRAPLRAISGFTQILMEDYGGKFDTEGEDALRRVQAASQRMGQLIDDLLKLSRVTRSEMHSQQVDLSAMIQSIATELQEMEPDRRVEFIIQPDLIVNGDARLLRIVLENLLNNAWKFTSKEEQARIVFGCEATDNESVFFVHDNGAGFDMAYNDKLFGTFQRLHTTQEFAGTGIGLATVRRIIRRHGGRIWAKGEVNQGATFYFTIGEPITERMADA